MTLRLALRANREDVRKRTGWWPEQATGFVVLVE